MRVTIAASALILALMPLSGVQANLLLNGDFTLGENDPLDATQPNELNPVDWMYWNGGGWNNRELNANGIAPDNPHMALGNAGATDQGVFQVVAATEGLIYQAMVDSGSPDSWWKPNGELKIDFMDAGDVVLASASTTWTMPNFDTLLPWQTYTTSGVAPVGTTQAKVLLMNQGPNGGTMRFDNASLVVIPEPTSLALLGLGACLARIFRRK
jgi:hypothetical protein